MSTQPPEKGSESGVCMHARQVIQSSEFLPTSCLTHVLVWDSLIMGVDEGENEKRDEEAR